MVSDGLSAEAVHANVPVLLEVLEDALRARGVRAGQPILARFARVKLAEEIATAVEADLVSKTSIVPFFAQGPDYFTLVQIDNLSNVQQTISVSAKWQTTSRIDHLPAIGRASRSTWAANRITSRSRWAPAAYCCMRPEMSAIFASSWAGIACGPL